MAWHDLAHRQVDMELELTYMFPQPEAETLLIRIMRCLHLYLCCRKPRSRHLRESRLASQNPERVKHIWVFMHRPVPMDTIIRKRNNDPSLNHETIVRLDILEDLLLHVWTIESIQPERSRTQLWSRELVR